nr:PAS domain S-box protein [Candidatus Omnitrophota bacterium]
AIELRKHKDRLESMILERSGELAESHRQIEYILGATQTRLDIIDTDYNIVYIDPSWKKVYGDPKNRKCYEYFMDRTEACPNCGVAKALSTKKPLVTEETLPKEGNRPIQVSTIPYQDKNGRWLVAEVNVDMTMRKDMEKALREKEEKARAILDHAFQFIGLLNPDGILLEANKAAIEFSGVDPSHVINKPFWDGPWWSHSPTLRKKLQEGIKSAARGEFVRFEATHPDMDGELHYIDFSLKPVKNKSGRVIYILPEGRDITERKNSEDELNAYKNRLEEMVKEKTEDLRASEEEFRAIFNDSRDGILLAEVETKNLVMCNKMICEMLGYAPEEIKKLSVKDIHPESDRQRVSEVFEKQAQGDLKMVEGLPMIRKDGTVFYADVNISRVELKGRSYLIGSFRDITERRQAEQIIRDREQLIDSVSNNLPNAMIYSIIRDKEGRRKFIYVSDAVRRFYGCSPAEAFADPNLIYGRVLKDDLERVIREEEAAFRANSVFKTEARVRNPSGTIRWSYFSSSPTKMPDGSTRWSGVELDITNRKLTEEAMIQSENNYRSIFELANDAIIIRDINTYTITDVNNKACEMFCYKKDEMVGLPLGFLSIFSEKQTEERLRGYYDSVSRGDNQIFEWLSKDKFGREFWSDISVKRAIIAGRSSIICIIRDITERKKAYDIKDNFTNMVSHELRTPLATIKESISLVSEGDTGPVTKEQRNMFDIVKRNVDRLARLINQVLDLQKIEAGAMRFDLKDNDINKITEEAYRTMLSLASKKGLKLALKQGDNLPRIRCDKDRINEVLLNLIDNAIRHTEKGAVTITTSVSDNYVKISVQDTGHGIEEKDVPKLFQRFSQLERKAGGTGLGLAISKEIIEAHAGTIWVESVPGQGSVFNFTIPMER